MNRNRHRQTRLRADALGVYEGVDLFEYFSGQSRAWGLFEDRFGKVRRQFSVDIEGRVSGDTLTLEEDFVYDDGELDIGQIMSSLELSQGFLALAV